jgi:hypothetical protein
VNKVFAGLGFILILAGLLVSTIGSINYDTWKSPPELVQGVQYSWTVEGNFSSGELLMVNIVINPKWETGMFEIADPGEETPYPYGWIEVYFDVIDPYGNKTQFTYIWMRYPSKSGEYTLVRGNLTVNQNGSLLNPGIVEVGAQNPGGMVRYSGLYIANITGILAGGEVYYPDTPPSVIQLTRSFKVRVKPYSSALPFGVASLIGGAGVSIYGIKFKEKKSKRGQMKRRL